MIHVQTHHSQTTCIWVNNLIEASLSLSFSSKMAIMGKPYVKSCSNKRYCECCKNWDFQCCISLIGTVSMIDCLAPYPTWAWRLFISSCRKATGQAFCFSGYLGGPAGSSGNCLHVRNPDSPRPSSFHSRCSNTRKRDRAGFARNERACFCLQLFPHGSPLSSGYANLSPHSAFSSTLSPGLLFRSRLSLPFSNSSLFRCALPSHSFPCTR